MYFAHFPYIHYDVEKNDSLRAVTHILKRAAFRQQIKDRGVLFYPHYIEEGDTPELLSYRVYGTSYYHWVILMLNERLNPYFDWPLSYRSFMNYLAGKYPTTYKSLIFTADVANHFTVGETVTSTNASSPSGVVKKWLPNLRQLVITVSSGTFGDNETVTGGTSNAVRTTLITGGRVNYLDAPHHYIDANEKEVNISASPAPTAVTNREYEDDINETNRSTKILKPEFLPTVIEEFQSLLID